MALAVEQGAKFRKEVITVSQGRGLMEYLPLSDGDWCIFNFALETVALVLEYSNVANYNHACTSDPREVRRRIRALKAQDAN